MNARRSTGAEALVAALQDAGVSCVFGVPGTQNVELFEALRRSRVRTVLAASELGAAFMANGYARTSGDVGVLVTIQGPGFTYALPGLAEARADSAAVLHITGLPARSPGKRFQLQSIDQAHIAGPLVKQVITLDARSDVTAAVSKALLMARSDEPGPVLLQVSGDVLTSHDAEVVAKATTESQQPPMSELREILGRARRPVFLLGQGALGSAAALQQIAEACRVPVLTTPSGRGVIAEDHPLSFGFDALRQDITTANTMLAESDLILALGCKLGHNGTAGFRLALPADRLIHVDASPEALNANYPARLAIHCQVATAVGVLAAALPASAWDERALAGWRTRLRTVRSPDLPEPTLRGVAESAPAAFFAALRRALPRDAVVVTDSGLHQIMTRRYYDVLAPHGLLLPSDFQSMGFGIPAAIGAAFAGGSRRVVAVVGDGGVRMTGMELTTAAREGLPLLVIVLNDGQLNQIRLQQLSEYGHAHAVSLGPLDLEGFAHAAGAAYVRLQGDVGGCLATALSQSGPTLLDVPLGDSVTIHASRASRVARDVVRRTLGPRLLGWLKRWK